MSLWRKLGRQLILRGRQGGYSQFGEDLILNFLFQNLGITSPTYLDVGANDPRSGNNTYSFYRRGGRGVLVEPNPRLAERLRAVRSRDVVVEAGVAFDAQREADFYQFPDHHDSLSTFSRETAEHWGAVGMIGVGKIQFEKIVRIPLVPLNDLISAHFGGAGPNLMSLDVEGVDFDALSMLDFEKYGPDVICVETLKYDLNGFPHKRDDMPALLLSKGYGIYADTYANSIYCRSNLIPKSA